MLCNLKIWYILCYVNNFPIDKISFHEIYHDNVQEILWASSRLLCRRLNSLIKPNTEMFIDLLFWKVLKICMTWEVLFRLKIINIDLILRIVLRMNKQCNYGARIFSYKIWEQLCIFCSCGKYRVLWVATNLECNFDSD